MARALLQDISLSEARRQLSALVRQIQGDPDVGYRIVVRKQAVAELRSPAEAPGRIGAAAALLRAGERINRGRPRNPRTRTNSVAANYKEMLYGKNGILSSGRGR